MKNLVQDICSQFRVTCERKGHCVLVLPHLLLQSHARSKAGGTCQDDPWSALVHFEGRDKKFFHSPEMGRHKYSCEPSPQNIKSDCAEDYSCFWSQEKYMEYTPSYPPYMNTSYINISINNLLIDERTR